MHNAYITKREAPEGYVAITRPLAEAMFNAGQSVILCSEKVNQFSITEREQWGFEVSKATADRPFALLIYDFVHELPPQLGKRCVFYANAEEAQATFESLTLKESRHNAQRKRYARRH
jgi:hypothetical protein